MIQSDLLNRKQTHFVLWRPRHITSPPQLVIGKLRPGNPPTFVSEARFDLHAAANKPDLWEIAASQCNLTDGEVYHYWFAVQDASPAAMGQAVPPTILCTDPTAWTVDWRLLAPRLPAPFGENDRDPAAVVKYESDKLMPCDPGGETVDFTDDPTPASLPANNRLVIYELPTRWTMVDAIGSIELGVGTFRDVTALIEPASEAANFSGLNAVQAGHAYLQDLGVNALELLPPADSFVDREWGYATSNYFAADYDLGFPKRHASPTASTDLANLIKTCHQNGIRFFTDVVMAFTTRYAYQNINFLDFHVLIGSGDPEEYTNGTKREGFGGDLFKYNYRVNGYDPISGRIRDIVPARQLMRAHLVRWMLDFRIDGIRMDSITNIGNWDFVQEFKDHARQLWRERWAAQSLPSHEAAEHFLVVGEELSVPIDLLTQNRLDGLWNEHFKHLVRSAILGQSADDEPSFEWTVRKLIDCRLLGFRDGAEAINYVTSHDVEGFRNERLFNFLDINGIDEKEERIKLAFACLLTAVGVPMIFAGEEFADQHDLATRHPEKQVDPVNYSRVEDPWRKRIFDYVSRLVKLRTSHDGLSVNDTEFIHVDFNDGKRVLVWQRGRINSGQLVVVVANFSDFGASAASSPDAEYVVPNWPATPAGMRWREVTQNREVPPEWVGREPVFPWEAKVYALF